MTISYELITCKMRGYYALRDALYEWSHLIQVSFDYFYREQMRTKEIPTKRAYHAYLAQQLWVQQLPKGEVLRLARYCLRYYRAHMLDTTTPLNEQDYYARLMMVQAVQRQHPCVLTTDTWRSIVGASNLRTVHGKWVHVSSMKDAMGDSVYKGTYLTTKTVKEKDNLSLG